MKICCVLALLLVSPFLGRAQNNALSLDDLLQNGQQWLQENADERVLRALQEVDQKQVEKLFRDVQQRFQGEYIVDLAQLKRAAGVLLPLLEQHAETQPYAAWLRTRLDYFEVAEQFRLIIPPPKVEPGQPPKPRPNPTPEVQRKAWQKQIEKRPLPKNAAPYVARLKPVFSAQRVPAQLIWVAEVESSFNPNARSPAGAAGMFQLMPPTAQSLGLSLRPKDERLDPDKSAGAAAKYLRYLYGQFKDWRLALAAYNVGEGRLRSLMTRHKATTFDQVATRLPAETQMYVPKMEAIVLRREGVSLAKLPAPRA